MNKTIVILGAGAGISQSVAKTFGRKGFAVALVSRHAEKLQLFIDELAQEDIVAKAFSADVSDAEGLKETIANIKETFASIDVLHYNAAAIKMVNVLDETADTLTEDFKVNVAGLQTAVLQTWNDLAIAKGAVLVTGGGLSMNPNAEVASLSIGKAGVRSLAASLSQALSSKGIFVGTITVNGMVSPESEIYSPDNIARLFWEQYSNRNEFEILL